MENAAKIETKRKAKIRQRKSASPATTGKFPRTAGRTAPHGGYSKTKPSPRKLRSPDLRRKQFRRSTKLRSLLRPRRDSCSSCCCAGSASATRRRARFARTIPANALHQPREFLHVGPFGAALSHDGKEDFFESCGSSFGAGNSGAQCLDRTLRS